MEGPVVRPLGSADPEKLELKEKPHGWIAVQIHCLDLKGYVEEIHSFRHFHRNSKSFALEDHHDC